MRDKIFAFYKYIKLLPNNADLYVSHVTWGPYEVMLKMLKHYKLNFHTKINGKKKKKFF